MEVHVSSKTRKKAGYLKTRYLREVKGVTKVPPAAAFCRGHCVLQEVQSCVSQNEGYLWDSVSSAENGTRFFDGRSLLTYLVLWKSPGQPSR
jgi:hypothetical protein